MEKFNSNQAQLHAQFLRYTVKRSKVKRTEKIILIHLNQKRSTFANFFFKFSNIAGYACSIPTIPSLPHPVCLFISPYRYSISTRNSPIPRFVIVPYCTPALNPVSLFFHPCRLSHCVLQLPRSLFLRVPARS